MTLQYRILTSKKLITKNISKGPLSTSFLSPRHFYSLNHSTSTRLGTVSASSHKQIFLSRTFTLFLLQESGRKNLEKTNSKPIIIHFQHLTEQPPSWLKTANATPSSRALPPTYADSRFKKRTPNRRFFTGASFKTRLLIDKDKK